LLGERSGNLLRKENLLTERKVESEQIDLQSLEMYENLKGKKKGVAVSEIVDLVCSACGAEVTPAEWQAARTSTTFVYCSSCGRILYAA